MLKPAKMKKVRVYALKSRLPAIIQSLHEAGIMEIKKFRTEGLESGRPLEFFDDVSTQLVRLRNMISNMDKEVVKSATAKKPDIDGQTAVKNAEKLYSAAGERLKEIANETSTISEEISRISSQLELIEKLEVFKGIDFSELSSKSLNFALGEAPAAKIESLRSKLAALKGNYTVLSPEKSNLVLILYSRDAQPMDLVLTESGFSALQLPEEMKTPEAEYSKLKMELNEKKSTLKKLEQERKTLSEKYVKKALELIEILGVESERTKISSKFADSARLSVMQGWIMEKNFNKLKKTIDSFGNDAVLEELAIEEKEQPPIVLENPKYQHPFEFITRSFSIPNYFELDPTLVYFIGIPLIYGMIIGDVVYGIFSILIALLFMKLFSKTSVMQYIAGIWYLSGFPSIFFGILFDEWAGMTHVQWFEFFSSWGLPIATSPLYTAALHRLHDFSLLLGITLVVGMVHVGIGFLLGAITLWKHHRKHAIAKLAWLGAEIGGVVAVAAGYFGLLPSAVFIPSLVLLGISVVVLVYIEGAIGALELPGLVGNILSYARVAAVGVAGVVLAELINDFFMPLPEAGLLALLLVPLLIILHFVNTFIAMFESIIQVGRLNIIEFRSKFLEGGGILFSPFALKKK